MLIIVYKRSKMWTLLADNSYNSSYIQSRQASSAGFFMPQESVDSCVHLKNNASLVLINKIGDLL